ncbi:MAG: PQQ-binding-like beta-propeller repeat protein [Lentisphaerae bacterium]|jgi:hypothetical protein|nr:PQQ-binding-like beta-propeller repeat protein [Lentisphaerota bacterium]MBT4819871.1 PQQ-binding-like beta-propeller repeat protein [Lentisphaerota bacterium]MBT5605071.1 PQQ-binding-like beta-propeller repeat protein [Lentisphaerota bacterium]MBT7058693.1 PQQ-binding-like beta-propeller repeat protein [Lentisphaerota bacterium]MBT7847034.1 PQQ-binding-like beta-propeller repeat protein [Lentisphaerota bacterium]
MHTGLISATGMIVLATTAASFGAASAEKLKQEQALLRSMEIQADQLKPLRLVTALVEANKAKATICHADAPAWAEAAQAIREAIRAATGITLETVTDADITQEQAQSRDLILLGHLDNNRHVARLYNNFFVCLDVGFTGRKGHVIRSVHDPFGTGHNAILVGGSFAEGTKRAAEAFVAKVQEAGKTGELTLGRLLEIVFDREDRQEKRRTAMTEKKLREDTEYTRKLFASPGRGRSGVARLIKHGVSYQRTGASLEAQAYREALLAMMNYYATDDYIKSEGLARYDRDFRDSWTHSIAITYDLLEESGVFTGPERLQVTNYLIRLGLECVLYQRWNRPDKLQHWAANDTIVHNHNTFPALGVHFVGTYVKRHYGVTFVDDWLTVAKGIFDGQKHCSKPLEDAAAYQWLPLTHVMIYTLATGDDTYFTEGHAADSAKVAQMVMDNAGYQAAFGDHPGYTSSSGIGSLLQRIGWKLRDPTMLWGARKASSGPVEHEHFNLGQPHFSEVTPTPPDAHVGVVVATLPRKCYDYAARSPQYKTPANLPWPETFDKIAFRAGLGDNDEYLLLDGFGRGTHMHFDANAIIRFAAGGKPLLVDGEYIKNAPKYHNSLVILRNGSSELTPAVTGLREAAFIGDTGITRSYLTRYNGAEWERAIIWRRGEYFLVVDTVTAQEPGDYTLRCCWRPWGEAKLNGATMNADHRPMRVTVTNADGAAQRLETMKIVHRLPVSRLSQQVSRSLVPGASYQFVNAVHAQPMEAQRNVQPRKISDGIVTVTGDKGLDLLALGPGKSIPGIATDASLLLLNEQHIVATSCQALTGEGLIVSASAPVSVELLPGEGKALVTATTPCELRLRTSQGGRVTWGDEAVEAGGDGVAVIALTAGQHALALAPAVADPAVAKALSWAKKHPGGVANDAPDQSDTPSLPLAWEHVAFDPPPEPLPVVSVTCDEQHSGRYGPIEKLTDGAFSSSMFSVQWPNGVAPTIVAELAEPTHVTRVVLREWHMFETWDIAGRTLEISSDGFIDDIRPVTEPFRETGTQRWGNNVNTLMAVDINQALKQARFVITPARDDSSVYLAEIEIRGTRPGRVPEVRALTSASFGKHGEAVVAGSASGVIRAFSPDGQALWTHVTEDQAAINTVACADVDGDGQDEVIYGADAARLGLLDFAGKERWHAEPPEFRGIRSDVITVFPADVNGDGRPEIVCGCLSWQYLAYDATGEMLWKNVIYAHSATVGCAVDLDKDGKDEVVGGNAYYCLNTIDHDGKRLVKADRLGPEQTAVAAADVDGDGQVEILLGTDGGELICFATDGKRRWTANVGDRVTRIVCLRTPQSGNGARILCAAESAHVFCFTGDGKRVWARSVGDGATDLALVDSAGSNVIATAAGSRGLLLLDLAGTPLAQAPTKGRAMRLTVLDGKLVTTTDQGRIQAFTCRLPKAQK